jgi:hypothetical protein
MESKNPQFKEAVLKRDQARERVRELIQRGKVQGNGYLPSVRKAAELIGLNRDAIWRAYLDLEQEGYIRKAPNRRFELHPGFKATGLRTLNVQLITVGVDSIRFSGLQRFYKTLLDQESGSKIRTHLKWAIDAAEITPEWIDQMDGVILAGHFDRYELLESLTQDIPCIGVITPQNWNADFMIDSDNQQIGGLAADHLWQSGATSPCVVAYSNQDGRHSLRKLGFQAKWIENGGSLSDFDEHWIDPTNTYKRVFELEQIARNLGDHDAVFCLEKESAIDLLNIFDCIGVNVPEEVKVISVDGTFEGLKTTPKLTYVKQKFEEMATIAAEQMRLLCADKANATTTDAKKKILVPAEIVLREST